MVEKSNYKHNRSIKLWDGYINGQGCGNVAKMKYGLYPMSFNGCEIIAIYNFLYSQGKTRPLADIAKEIYPYGSVLVGLFGTNPKKLKRYLDDHGFNYRRTEKYDEYEKLFDETECSVMSFWVKQRNGFYGIHTVFIRNINGKVRVYNRSNGNPRPKDYERMSDFLPNGKHLIVAFCFGDKNGK